jgi:hypothetical protein
VLRSDALCETSSASDIAEDRRSVTARAILTVRQVILNCPGGLWLRSAVGLERHLEGSLNVRLYVFVKALDLWEGLGARRVARELLEFRGIFF